MQRKKSLQIKFSVASQAITQHRLNENNRQSRLTDRNEAYTANPTAFSITAPECDNVSYKSKVRKLKCGQILKANKFMPIRACNESLLDYKGALVLCLYIEKINLDYRRGSAEMYPSIVTRYSSSQWVET